MEHLSLTCHSSVELCVDLLNYLERVISAGNNKDKGGLEVGFSTVDTHIWVLLYANCSERSHGISDIHPSLKPRLFHISSQMLLFNIFPFDHLHAIAEQCMNSRYSASVQVSAILFAFVGGQYLICILDLG